MSNCRVSIHVQKYIAWCLLSTRLQYPNMCLCTEWGYNGASCARYDLWTLWCVLANSSELHGHNEVDLWKLDAAFRGLLLICHKETVRKNTQLSTNIFVIVGHQCMDCNLESILYLSCKWVENVTLLSEVGFLLTLLPCWVLTWCD